MIALDISKSMLAEDLRKGHSRLSIAKKGISKLIKKLHGDHIGIVVFARNEITDDWIKAIWQLSI